ncbi:glycogen/starch/alpha-glucan family phosphorylase [Acholeplasma sp. OttesenSCG-928-E16]|nr:glycogen/starch/alpha-glucan family phosphorylase [Acholeplasma sp. OttesenSCG-928-E16]
MNNFKTVTIFENAYKDKLKRMFNTTPMGSTNYERYQALASLVVELINENKIKTEENFKDKKKAIYFSMEFLMGRLITNNLFNLGVYDTVKKAFIKMELDINEIELFESDAGLGNGGLGRLAACFLDSGASLALPLYGNSIRYRHGFFIQDIKKGKQVEYPDNWLTNPFVWEERKIEESVEIPFFGEIKNGSFQNQIWVKAVPYDVFIVGDQNQVVNKLRLWSAEKSDRYGDVEENYIRDTMQISEQLYPDDSTEYGKLLRLKQQYFFSAAGIKNIINEQKKANRDIKDLDKYYVCQINDTHPTLIIPELMRILMDEEGLEYDEAWNITTNMCAFTNHTILSEALEKWNVDLFKLLLPRIYEIVCEINKRFNIVLEKDNRFNDTDKNNMAIIGNNEIRMAHICIVGSFSVNGVAKLHTDILKHIEMKNFNKLYPKKFNNKTNGITHRRWLIQCNKELSETLDKYLTKSWRKNINKMEKLIELKDDENLQYDISQVKRAKKIELAKVIKADTGISLDVDSIFDIQVKRLHEYKRQLLNILHIIYVYQRLKSDLAFKNNYYPHSFIFGAKAAPSYYIAKRIIQLINLVADKVNNDFETNHLLKVVFVRNYNVTYAEHIMPAADLSEQISTASKEASGTGNMKFMMNGALTIGTLDGANVEITELAGIDNEIIFGLTAKEVTDIYQSGNYRPYDIYLHDERIRKAIDFFETLSANKNEFQDVKHNLLNRDYFLVLKDFDAYVKAHEIANDLYKNRKLWLEKSIINIAKSSFFTSDRTIKQYNKDIWKLKK